MDQTMDKQPLTFLVFSKKTKKSKNTVTKLILLILSVIVFCYVLLLISKYYYYFDDENLPQKTDQKCFCRWRKKYFNICYKMPFSPMLEGEPFSCDHLPIIKSLNLLDFENNKNIYPSTNSPQIITAFSSTYFIKGLNMIAEYRKIVPRDRIIVYDIGLTQNQSQILSNICNVVVEKLNFDDFPKYFKILTHYRWKPILITKAIQKYGSIIYVDSSVHFRNTNYLRIPSLVNCRSIKNYSDNNNEVKCTHFPYMLHSYTGHSIHYATMTNVYRYIPTIKETMKKTKMYEAGLAYVTPTKETFEILKWSVLCALEEYCILPYYAPLHDCYKSANSITPTCHRFDQSVINILLFNANNYNLQNYTSGITNFFSVQRGVERKPNYGLLKSC